MEKFKHKYNTRSNRLRTESYTSGLYFVTICTKDRIQFLSEISMGGDGVVANKLTPIGEYLNQCVKSISEKHPYAVVHEYVIMPDHFHVLLQLKSDQTEETASLQFGKQSHNLPSILRGLKGAVTTYAKKNQLLFQWQSGYYERVIRYNENVDTYVQYIINNPINWYYKYVNPSVQ